MLGNDDPPFSTLLQVRYKFNSKCMLARRFSAHAYAGTGRRTARPDADMHLGVTYIDGGLGLTTS